MNIKYTASRVRHDINRLIVDLKEFLNDLIEINKEAKEFLDDILKDDLIPPATSWSVSKLFSAFIFRIGPHHIIVNDKTKRQQFENTTRGIVIQRELKRRLRILRNKSQSQFKLKYMELLYDENRSLDKIISEQIKSAAIYLLETEFKDDKAAIEKLALLR